eukprot:m.170205 g.170205  ORF g.170205 m.170205 type:complete len:1127 (-) comp16683_c1_seq3:139-3519(-)
MLSLLVLSAVCTLPAACFQASTSILDGEASHFATLTLPSSLLTSTTPFALTMVVEGFLFNDDVNIELNLTNAQVLNRSTSLREDGLQLDAMLQFLPRSSAVASLQGTVSISLFGAPATIMALPEWNTVLYTNVTVLEQQARTMCDAHQLHTIVTTLESTEAAGFSSPPAALSSVLTWFENLATSDTLAPTPDDLASQLQSLTLEDLTAIVALARAIATASTVPTQRISVSSEFMAEQCGDAICNMTYESCQSCEVDCGLCAYNVAVGPDGGYKGEVAAVVGSYQEWGLGAARVSAMLDRVPKTQTKVSLEMLTQTFFPLFEQEESYAGLHDPWQDTPVDECFSGLAIAYYGTGDVDNMTFTVDLSDFSLFDDAAWLPVARFWNGSQWVALPTQHASARTLSFVSPEPQQVSVFTSRINATVQALELEAALPKPEGEGTRVSAANSFSNVIAEALERFLETAALTIIPGEDLAVETEELIIRGSVQPIAAMNGLTFAIDGVSSPTVILPPDFDQALEGLTEATLLFSVFKDGPIEQGVVPSSLVDFTVKSGALSVVIENLPTPVELRLFADLDAPDYQQLCRFWNASLPKVNCTPPEDDLEACLGDWDTRGVVKVEELSGNGTIVCRTTHLSTFSVGVDFTITPPQVSADNFNPANAPYIWILWGSFYSFCGIMYIYAYLERRAYDRRQAMLEAGLLHEDDLGPRPKSAEELDFEFAEMGFFKGWFHRFKHEFKSKHQWLAILLPSGKKVFPKRSVKVTAFMSTTSMAFGMMAMFAYTESQNPGENTNTLRVTIAGDSVYLPLEGFWSFLITFPFLIFLSICLAKYSTYLDLLRKIAPERYRNHAILKQVEQKKAVTNRNWNLFSYPQDEPSAVPMSGKTVQKQQSMDGADENWIEGTIQETKHLTLSQSSSPEPNDEYLEYLDETGWLDAKSKARGRGNTSSSDLNASESSSPEPTPEQAMLEEFNRNLDSAFDISLDNTSQDSGIDGSESGEKTHTDAEIDELDRTMRFYRRLAYAMAYFLLIGGLVNALVFMGSMTGDIQVRYLKAVGQFLILSGIVTAPLILLWASGKQQYKMVRKRGKMTEEEWAGSMATATAIATALVLSKAMIHREITRAIRESFDINII